MKNNDCFYCLNHDSNGSTLAENTGWYHPCKFGIENEDMKIDVVKKCEKYFPNVGFQIGGYYSHVHFEIDGKKPDKDGYNPCLEMVIHSDGVFPKEDPDEMTYWHICDFEQLEEFVEFWGRYLRKKGVISKRRKKIWERKFLKAKNI